MGQGFHSIDSLPEPGDIVWCKWPIRERPGQPGPWVRPTLVRESDIRDDPETGERFGTLLVCYGTEYGNKVHGLSFSIATMERARAVGLHKPTTFGLSGGNAKRFIWGEQFFVAPDYVRGAGLIVGRLDEEERRIVGELLAASS